MDDSETIDEHSQQKDLDSGSIEKEQAGSPPLRRKRAGPSEQVGSSSMDPVELDNPVNEEGAPDGLSSGILLFIYLLDLIVVFHFASYNLEFLHGEN